MNSPGPDSVPDKARGPRALPARARTALVIDDDELVCRAIADQLRSLGIPQVLTSQGDHATVRLINEAGPFDLVITDLAMPTFDGLQLTRLLAARQPGAAIVYLSATGSRRLAAARTLAEQRGLRVLGALEKPLRLKALGQIVDDFGVDTVPPAPMAAPAPARSGNDAYAWSRLLERLEPLQPLRERLGAVRACRGGPGLADAADGLGAELLRHCTRLESDRAGAVRLLDQATTGLDEMAGYLSSDAASRHQAQDERQRLSSRLMGEVTDLDANIRGASDLAALQDTVRRRLERISLGLHESKAREETRMHEFEQRSLQMKSRIDQLEAQAHALQESVEREHAAAATDRLTGIPNRLDYDRRIRQAWLHWQRYGGAIALAVWDIDRFKAVNDTYGHAAGDKALQAVGRQLAAQVRGTDFVARYGGEEFAMVLHGVETAAALALADKLRESIARIGFRFKDQPVTLTASCGLTVFATDDTPESAFERADAALYQAKHSGRNRCVAG